MSERFEIEIHSGKKDLWRAVLSRYFSLNNLIFWFLGLALFGSGLMIFSRGFFNLLLIVDVFILAAVFTVFYMLVMTYLSVGDTDKYIGEKYIYIFTNNEIQLIGSSFKSDIKWNHFYRVKETAKNIILYDKSRNIHQIPKKYIRENELNDFKNLLREKFGSEAYLKKGKLGLK